MSDSFVQVPVDSTGKKIDSEQLVVGANAVERQRAEIAGAGATEIAVVKGAAPTNAAMGLGVRQIPGTDNMATTGHTAGTGAADALVANANRKGVLIQNISDTRVFIRFGPVDPVATAGSEVGIAVEANGGAVSFTTNVDTRVIRSITTAASKRLLITEW